MGCNIRHLNPVNGVVSFYHMVKPMLPMHCHQGKPLFICKQESCVFVHHSLIPWCFPVLDDGLETPEYVFGHRQLPGSSIGFRWLDNQPHIRSCRLLPPQQTQNICANPSMMLFLRPLILKLQLFTKYSLKVSNRSRIRQSFLALFYKKGNPYLIFYFCSFVPMLIISLFLTKNFELPFLYFFENRLNLSYYWI